MFSVSWRKRVLFLFFSFFLIVLGACSTYPPLEEYVLAHVALNAAKAYQGNRYARVHQNKADQIYDLAVKRFKNKNFNEARKLFLQSIHLAEKTENISRLRQLTEEDL